MNPLFMVVQPLFGGKRYLDHPLWLFCGLFPNQHEAEKMQRVIGSQVARIWSLNDEWNLDFFGPRPAPSTPLCDQLRDTVEDGEYTVSDVIDEIFGPHKEND